MICYIKVSKIKLCSTHMMTLHTVIFCIFDEFAPESSVHNLSHMLQESRKCSCHFKIRNKIFKFWSRHKPRSFEVFVAVVVDFVHFEIRQSSLLFGRGHRQTSTSFTRRRSYFFFAFLFIIRFLLIIIIIIFILNGYFLLLWENIFQSIKSISYINI